MHNIGLRIVTTLQSLLNHSADCDTDHSLVISSMLLRSKPSRYKVREPTKVDIQKNRLTVLMAAYCDKLQLEPYAISDSEYLEEYWNSLCSHTEAARNSGNIRGMYESIKSATGAITQTCETLR